MRSRTYLSTAKVALFLAVLVPGASLAQSQISGVVTEAATGDPINGIDIDVFDAAGLPVTITGGSTGATGAYTITLPGPGTYTVRADPGEGDGFADQWFPGSFLRSGASAVTVGSTPVGGISFALDEGFRVRGTVSSGGVGVASIDLDVYDAATGEIIGGVPGLTDVDGTFSIGDLPPGTYQFRAQPDPALGQFYVTTWNGDTADQAASTPLVVGAADVDGADIAIAAGGFMQGIVRGTGGAGVGGLDLDIYDASGARMAQDADTAADGTYATPVLPAGNYLLRVNPTLADGYPNTWFPAAYSQSLAGVIPVLAGQPTSSIDFDLVAGGTVTGRVTSVVGGAPLANIDLDVYDAAGTRLDVTTRTLADGTYTVGPVAPQSVILRADPDATQGYLLRYWNNAADFASATAISVAAGVATPNINFALPSAGWITGTVVAGAGGAPIPAMDIDLYDAATGTRVNQGASTRADGTYTFGPVAPGTYKMRCDPEIAQGFAVQYWNGQLARPTGNTITVAAGAGTPNINFSLVGAGTVSGRVTDLATGAPVAGVDVDLFQAGTLLRMDQSALTDANGTYTVGRVPAGSYVVLVDTLTAPYADTYYPNSATAAGATPVAVTVGGALANINVALPPAADGDTDRDGFSNVIEAQLGSNANDPASRPAFGDTNGDGDTTALDGLILIRTSPRPQSTALDVNRDGTVDACDGRVILLWSLGVPPYGVIPVQGSANPCPNP